MGNGELERSRRAVERTPADHPRRAERMRRLGRLWRRHALATGNSMELDRAIGYFRGALSRAGTALAAAEYNLALLLSDRHDALGVAADMEEAIESARRALADLPAESGHRHDYLALLGLCLWERYDATGSLNDLQRAIDAGTEAGAAAEPRFPLWPRLNSNLGMMYLDRYERSRDAADLDRAIALAAVAVESAPQGDDRCFDVALNVIKPSFNSSHQNRPATGSVWPSWPVPDYIVPSVEGRFSVKGEI